MGKVIIIALFIPIVLFEISIMISCSKREKELQKKEEELEKEYRDWYINRFNRRR